MSARQRGVRVSIQALRDLHRQAQRLDNMPTGAVASLFPGSWRARLRGRGLEFEEVRAYQWGDDYRTVDWRVTARTGQMHTKLFHEERERTLHLVLDAGPAMQFGTRHCFKWVRAAEAGALFAWLVLDQDDRVGAVIHGDGRRCHRLRPSASEAGLSRLFNLLAGVKPRPDRERTTLTDALAHLRRQALPGSLILLIGDFRDFNEEARRHLAHLAHHGEIAAIRIIDPLERELPPGGLYPLTDGRQRLLLDTTSASLRQQWRESFDAHQQQVQLQLRRLGARSLLLGTHQPLVETLRRQLRGERQG